MGRLLEYFVVCGLGPEMQSTDGKMGFHGTSLQYMPSLLDQFPPSSSPSTYPPPPPPQLPLCVLPAGVEFYSAGPSTGDESSYPRSYPIVLTDGDGSKIYVGCVAFRDPVDDDIAQAYRIPPNSYVDKCICVVSHTPCFQVFRDALEELHHLCFSTSGCGKPIWEIIAQMVSNIPLPNPGQGQVLFALENYLLSVEVPTKNDLPHADLSFQPLLQCLDIRNTISLFTAILLEKRILLRASKYSLLTLVAEAICHLIYPIKWQHVYIPVLFYGGVDYIDAPTPYLMGLHSGVDTSDLTMEGVIVVDLDHNKITFSEDIPLPLIPEPELGQLTTDLVQLLHPNLKDLDSLQHIAKPFHEPFFPDGRKPWSRKHDLSLRLMFLKFFASILSEYRNFVEDTAANVFNKDAFLRKRSRMTNLPVDPMMDQFLGSQGFLDFLERGYGSAQAGENLMDKLQEATKKGQPATAILPLPSAQPEIITISDFSSHETGSSSRYSYDRFPASARTQAQEERRKTALSGASTLLDRPARHNMSPAQVQSVVKAESLSPRERAAERERMVLDIKVKLQGLWLRLLQLGATEDPLSSFEYGTILALIESDAEGIGGSGFIECIGEHIIFGWDCLLSKEQFIAVKELIKTTVSRAISRRDILTVRAALEYSALVHRRDAGNIHDYIQRHLGALPIWNEEQFWEDYFNSLMEKVSDKSESYSTLVAEQLILIVQHMAGVGITDADAWFILESIAQKCNLGSKQLIKLRGLLTYLQQVKQGYWGSSPVRAQTLGSFIHGIRQHKSRNDVDESPPPAEAAVAGRSWVQSMFSRDRTGLAAGQDRRTRSESSISVPSDFSQNATHHKGVDASNFLQKKGPSGVRTLRGHKASVTALHVAVKSEAEVAVADYDDSGYFISGSADCTVKIWDPTSRGSELRATLQGHTRAVRAITSDKVRIVSGSDDHRVLVWDKNSGQLLEELKGHDGTVSCVQMLSDPCVLTASHDGSVRMWDVRTDTCVATVCRTSNAILCMKCDHTTRILAAAGVDGMVNIWDTRAGKQEHKLLGHTKWVRCLSMAGDTLVTGSDDWTARVWTISRGTCDATLVCHGGAITSVEYCPADRGIVTGSSDGMVRLWESEEGILRCVKNVGIHNSTILSVKAGEEWLAIGAADNSMSLFHRPVQHSILQTSSGNRMTGWQLYRTPQRTAAIVRCVASDPDRGRICSGSRNGLLRLWEAPITV